MTRGLFDPYDNIWDDNDNNHQEDTSSSQEFADWDDDEAWEDMEADIQVLFDILEDDDCSQN